MAKTPNKEIRPVMCACLLQTRPMIFNLLFGALINNCPRCEGLGWLTEHPFTGDNECTICGWKKEGHYGQTRSSQPG